MTSAPQLASIIGGAAHPSAGDTWIDSVNPSDASDIVARVPGGTPDDVHAALRAATSAYPAWRALTGMQRAEHLHRWAGVVAARQEELAQAMAREVGKPMAEARGEAARAVVICATTPAKRCASGEVIPAQAADALQFTLREPLGVAA